MDIKFNVTKDERKALVKEIALITGHTAVFKHVPSFAYEIGNLVVDRNGTLIYEESSREYVGNLLARLAERGFASDNAEVKPDVSDTVDRLVIEVPIEGFTSKAFDNLDKIIKGKGELMKKAFDIGTLEVVRTDSSLQFPWFKSASSSVVSDEVDAYSEFVISLCEMAKKQRRVTMKEADIDSEKFAFRTFLIRLGFVGKEYSKMRKILLSRLEGNGAFKNGNGRRLEK